MAHDQAEECHEQSPGVGQQGVQEVGSPSACPPVISTSGKREGDVKSLLQFVNIATTDIKAALDKSAPCKRSVDHRKYLQKQLRRFSAGPPLNTTIKTSPSSLNSASSISSIFISTEEDAEVEDSNSYRSASPLSPDLRVRQPYYPLGQQQQQQQPSPGRLDRMSITTTTRVTHTSTSASGVSRTSGSTPPPEPVLDVPTMPGLKPGEVGNSKTLPLRQRHLPASFWQEPNRDPRRMEYAALPAYPIDMKPYDYKGVLSTTFIPPPGHYPIVGLTAETRPSGVEYLPQGFLHKYPHLTHKYPSELMGNNYYAWHYGVPPTVDNKTLQPHSQTTLAPPVPAHSLLYRQSLGIGGTTPLPHGWELAPTQGLLAQRPQIWRPIPTKTLSSCSTRYHPFADVHWYLCDQM